MASLDRFIKKKAIKNILFMPKGSRLEVKKTLVRLSNGKKQNGGQKQDGRPFESWTQIRLLNGRA
jgi:hypothetical protein